MGAAFTASHAEVLARVVESDKEDALDNTWTKGRRDPPQEHEVAIQVVGACLDYLAISLN